MPEQLGPLPNSEFPDMSLEIALKAYLKTLEQIHELLQDYHDIKEIDIHDMKNALIDLYKFLDNSRSVRAILPYRLQLLQNVQKAIAEISVSEALIRDHLYPRQDPRFFSSVQRTSQMIDSIRDTLMIGLSKPIYPK